MVRRTSGPVGCTPFPIVINPSPTPRPAHWDGDRIGVGLPATAGVRPVRPARRRAARRQLIADTTGAYRVLETSHPPTWYLPRADALEAR